MFSSSRLGTHEVKGGFEYFVSTRIGGNSQTSTGYVFQTDYKLDAANQPALDANGRLIPRFVPGNARVQVWKPLRGAEIDLTTASFFVNDRWVAARRLTVDLGLRFEKVGSEATGGIESIDVTTLVPRVAAAYALTGDGKTVLQATYGHYAGKYNDVQFSRNTNVGNADRAIMQYVGPAGEGVNFAPGFDPANYTVPVGGTFPSANIFFGDDLESPLTKEFSVALAREIGRNGWARATYVNRKATNFVEDFITIDGGITTIDINGLKGNFDNAIYRNTDLVSRDYQALDVQSAYRITPSLSVNGQWTMQIENHGNFEGESANNPAIPSFIGRLSGNLQGRPQLPVGPPRRLPGAQGAGVGELHARHGEVRPPRRGAALSLQLAAHLQPGGGVGADDGATGGRQPRLRADADDAAGVLRRARLAGVRGLRAVRPRPDLRRAGVGIVPSLGEARDAEPVQQPGHDLRGTRRSRPTWRVRRTPTACR